MSSRLECSTFWSGKGVDFSGVFSPINAKEGESWIYYSFPQNCNEKDSIKMYVGCDFDLFVPSTVTPNNDFTNDDFMVFGYNIVDYHIKIFDSWGAEIFSSNDINANWDCTHKSRLVPTGVYTYVINYSTKNANFYNKTGHINVVY